MSISNAVKYSSPKAIESAFKRVVKTHLPQERWLGRNNRYRKKTTNRIEEDCGNTPTTIKERQMAEYISVSTITHCSDGWNYLSRAIESIIFGDEMTAIHLAYYAELRAVMSLMAAQGIGIFNKKHIYFNASQSTKYFSSNTHIAAHKLINEWALTTNNQSIIFDIIKVDTKTLDEWFRATNYGHITSIKSMLLKNWLQKWSIDLKLDEDRNIRNEISYRPKLYPNKINCREMIEKISEIWEACEPTPDHSFKLLDSHLLRITLDEVYSRSGQSKTQKKFITDTINSLGLSQLKSSLLFLLRNNSPDDHPVIQEAKKEVFDNINNKYDCLPIICRALLLLRLSTGVTEKLLIKYKTIIRNLTKFWWQSIGLNLGLWGKDQEPTDFSDLYQDIADSLQTIGFDDASQWISLKEAADLYMNEFIKLKQFQRVVLWGIGL